MGTTTWQRCLSILEGELSSSHFDTWIRPLQAKLDDEGNVCLLAPNKYIRDEVREQYLGKINNALDSIEGGEKGKGGKRSKSGKGRGNGRRVQLRIGSAETAQEEPGGVSEPPPKGRFYPPIGLNKAFTFDTFVGGDSNQLALAAALQVAESARESSYNPLLLYGGVGLGKTHLMHAVGNALAEREPKLNIVYMYVQRFMEDMVRAIKQGSMLEFASFYHSVDVLLMDDIQFLAKGDKSQEEFFNVFNRLHEGRGQIVLTCDRYPKEVDNLEKRLVSRFVGDMAVPIEPPELETRVAILIKKAEQHGAQLPNDVAFFIAERIRSNVRELEGALKRIMAEAKFGKKEITIDLVKTALKDVMSIQSRLISIENIQKTTADYYNIRVDDLKSKSRAQSITRPRQLAMALARELTTRSLPEIGRAFGDRDHTTVLYACRKVEELKELDGQMRDDYNNLERKLTT